jgi:hypothetical protein
VFTCYIILTSLLNAPVISSLQCLLTKRSTSCHISGSQGDNIKKVAVLSDAALCSLVSTDRRFRGCCCLPYQGYVISGSVATTRHGAVYPRKVTSTKTVVQKINGTLYLNRIPKSQFSAVTPHGRRSPELNAINYRHKQQVYINHFPLGSLSPVPHPIRTITPTINKSHQNARGMEDGDKERRSWY